MARNVPATDIYRFITGDFEDSWDSLALNPGAKSRGNFMFARQAMTLLEWAARLSAADSTGAALSDLSKALMQREPKYFTSLPAVCADFEEFDLPFSPGVMPQQQLLWALFDLVRNGQAHQYQQIVLDLTGGKDLMISHNGAQFSLSLQYVRSQGRVASGHLGYKRASDGNLYLLVRPEWLLFDIKDSVDQIGLLFRGLQFENLARPRPRRKRGKPKIPGPYYQFDSAALEAAFVAGGHPVNQYGPP